MKLRSYVLVTLGYWAFTVTDGALRMLVLLYFHDLGYSPVSLAFLFLLYELFGVVTNLLGGWVGARTGLNRTLIAGLALQILALIALSAHSPSWAEAASVAWVMGSQALSGIAKDLTKMSSKSAVKLVATEGALFRWVAALTGSKNALKGVGFFVGGALLASLGFDRSLIVMAAGLALVLLAIIAALDDELGKAKKSPSLGSIMSKSSSINLLSAARFFLFGARDIWFVVALPVFLSEDLNWSFTGVGAFLAAWVIGYGVVQSFAPVVLRWFGADDEVKAATWWAAVLAAVTTVIALAASFNVAVATAVIVGLLVFGAVFAVNSSLHSFLILAYSTSDDVAMDVGFYYSANAGGRLVGTLLSGLLYLVGGFALSVWGSALFVLISAALAHRLPPLVPATDHQHPAVS